MKCCTKCLIEKPLSEFYKHQKKCKVCRIAISKEYNKKKYTSIEPGVYMVKCLINGKCYIGKSVKPYRRKTDHLSIYTKWRRGPSNKQLQADIKQYGKGVFLFGIIEHCEPSELKILETQLIKQYNPEYND